MAGNHPAKIAKYLLKGWCLLNEYCPLGHNIPLVRSRQGQVVCVCCDRSCPHFCGDDGEPNSKPLPAEAGVDAPATLPQSTNLKLSEPSPRDVSGYTRMSPYQAPRNNEISAVVGSGDAGSIRVAVTSLKDTFSCVRLVSSSSGIPCLLGESYSAKLQAGTYVGASVEDLSGVLGSAISKSCQQLANRILIPQDCSGADISRSASQVTVTCKDSKEYAFPERECIFLQSVSQDMLAYWILDAVPIEDLAGRVEWMEVSLTSSIGEVSCRRAV
jgi:hypothetical protein